MTGRSSLRLLALSLFGLSVASATVAAQNVAPDSGADLEYIVVLSRHGVRPPISKPGAIDNFSAAPWPSWEVPPGYLTPHGYQLMKLFGVWDRAHLSSEGLFASSGCADAARVTIVADSDERTRETGKALAEGMFPACPIEVHAKPEGTPDPLFRTNYGFNGALAAADIAGRIGNNADNLTAALHPQLEALDRVLAGCGHAQSANPNRTSIFDIHAGISDSGSLRGPVGAGATFAENLLLEYTNGMSNVGWGCVDGATLRFLMQIDTANWDYNFRTHDVARMDASNLLYHIEKSLEQHVAGKPVSGALDRPGDRMLLIVGHDTNIATISGALGLDWALDGRIDDPAPGGALLFEIWKSRGDGQLSVRMEYTAQTLEQMRESQPLTATNPPASAPLFIPACSRQDMACTWDGFSAALRAVIDPANVNPRP